MKAIELTEDRKEKLLEMCRALFPEYTIRFNINGFDYGIFIVTKDAGNTLNITHWFEFCFTHLVNKIYYPDCNGKRNTRQEVELFFFQSFIDSVEGATSEYKHPIDYLYEQFKN
jgi:hypothetical protein